MKRTVVSLCAGIVLALSGCETLNSVVDAVPGLAAGGPLTEDTIAAGLRQALEVGTRRTTDTLSSPGGYARNDLLRLGVPESIEPVTDALRKVGLGEQVDRFENKMNEAAEKAAAQAAPVFIGALREMTFADARTILEGSETAATDYFRNKTLEPLTALYSPIVRKTMDDVGAARLYNTLMDRYEAIPFARKPDFSLENYVTEQALNGLFTKLADMERDIRENPAARSTALLKRVFGSVDN